MASVKVLLYTSKTLKSGEHPILLRIIKDRQQIKISLGINCHPDQWDDSNNQPKRRHPLFHEIKTAIDKAERNAEKLILDYENQDKPYTLDELKVKLLRQDKKTAVYEYIDECVKRLKSTGRIGYGDIFHATKKSLMAYQGEKDFPFIQINHSFLSRWEEYHMKKGTKPNSFFVYIRTFKTILNMAKKEELVPSEFDPFKGISFARFKRIKTRRRAISKAEIEKLAKLDLEEGSLPFHARNYFIFSFYCRGINIVDIAHLKWVDIKESQLFYKRRKTKENFIMGLLPPAKEILELYRTNFFRGNDTYIFPILTEFHKTEQQKDNRINKVSQQVNAALKELGTEAGINEPLTTYVARHSFASVLKKSGIPTSQISEMMGHDSEATTRIYLQSFENEVLDEASKVLL
ncbi:site-specific integrase [Fibrella sp. USSR17]